MANDIGRPTLMTPETIDKLEEVFLNGGSDKEACFVANISTTTLYNYCQEHPDFLERKENLKNMLKYQARAVLAKAIRKEDGDKAIAQWYLERKAKDEFAQRSEHTGKDGASLLTVKVTPEDLRLANELQRLEQDNTREAPTP